MSELQLRLPWDVPLIDFMYTFACIPELSWQQTRRLWPALGSERSTRRALKALVDRTWLGHRPHYTYDEHVRSPRPGPGMWHLRDGGGKIVRAHYPWATPLHSEHVSALSNARLADCVGHLVAAARDDGATGITIVPEYSCSIGGFALRSDALIGIYRDASGAMGDRIVWRFDTPHNPATVTWLLLWADRRRFVGDELQRIATTLHPDTTQHLTLSLPHGAHCQFGSLQLCFVGEHVGRMRHLQNAWRTVGGTTPAAFTYPLLLNKQDWYGADEHRMLITDLVRPSGSSHTPPSSLDAMWGADDDYKYYKT